MRHTVNLKHQTWPAINCPNPGGKVNVEIRRVTTAGNTSLLREAKHEKVITFYILKNTFVNIMQYNII